MQVVPTGVFFSGVCDIQTELCTARSPAPITAVKTLAGGSQINVCRACLEELVRDGQWEIPGARLSHNFDMAVLDSRSNPVLIVECKLATSQPGRDHRARATQIRRNLLSHRAVPDAPFMMVVYYPTMAFLWVNSNAEEAGAEPNFSLDITDDLNRIPITDTGNNFQNAELHVSRWIRSVLETAVVSDHDIDHSTDGWLIASGLIDAVRGGTLVEHPVNV